MVGTSKILTVSYGTFSCTLEGFDEPFSTMKAIAEYFRDLAADDRYFGAEPPTPDAEMLHRIAEREIQRRVDARIGADGVVLNAAKPAMADAARTTTAAHAAPTTDIPAPQAPQAPAVASGPAPVSAADKLSRIRAVVAERSVALGSTAETVDADLDDAGQPYGDVSDADFGFDLDLPAPPPLTGGATGEAADESAAPAPILPTAPSAADEIYDDEAPSFPEVATGPDFDEDEDADAIAAETPASQPGLDPNFVERARARVIKIRRHDTAPQPVFPAAPAAPATEAVKGEPASVAEPPRQATTEAPATDESADKDGMGEDTLLAEISATLGETGLDAEAEAELMRELAEVARGGDGREPGEGRAILEGPLRDDEEALSRLMEVAKSRLEGDENRRRFSAISHLKAAVAATVADRKLKVGDSDGTGEDAGDAAIDRYREDLSRVVRPHRPDPDDLAGPRGDEPPLVLVSEQRIVPNRVAPSPEPEAPRTPRPDEDEDDADAIIAAMPSPETAKNFAEFAERMGATGLSDLLEAAAVYTSTVEGLPHFSRPHVLLKVAHVADDASYSREDGLRTFGMLLREGKIEKLRRGQFKITDASRFLPDGKRA
ncbi:MAG: hypothetical protein KDE08_00530 [Rhodobacteraceae bacterium]|nr:hypothetical protein [Paracoccaceae bacterium]